MKEQDLSYHVSGIGVMCGGARVRREDEEDVLTHSH